jgi:hypothetical protein
MRVFLVRGLVAAVLTAGLFWTLDSPHAQSRPSEFLLEISQPVHPEFVTIAYLVKGKKSDDGYINFGRSGSDLNMTVAQEIPISLILPHNEVAATALKAIVFCRDYGIALVRVPSLADVQSYRLTVNNLVPLGTVPMKGRIALTNDYKPEELRLDLHYDLTLAMMAYFETNKGLGSSGMRVATTTIAPDGTFVLDVPDFVHDPVIVHWGNPGRFNFVIRALRPYNGASSRSAGVQVSGRSQFGPDAGIPVAASYPDSLQLEVRWR